MRVHVLGIGAVGTLLSTHLRLAHPATPISLLLRSQSSIDDFWLDKGGHRRGGSLLVQHSSDPSASISATSFNTELTTANDDSSPILSLFTTLKCPAILPALRSLAPRLSKESTVVLLHNGMGVHDQLIRDLFVDEKRRPTFILGTTTHGVRTTKDRFEVVHHEGGKGGEMSFAVVPSASDPPESLAQTLDLLQTLPAPLRPKMMPHEELLPKLLHKVILNSIVNPLTALLSVPNGALASSPSALALIHSLAAEAASIMSAAHPYLKHLADPAKILGDVLSLARATASNRSSMLQDLDAGRETEIEFISGYMVEMGRKVGRETKVNEVMRGLVMARSELGDGGVERV